MNILSEIKKDRQIWKFCFYGLLKNLNFFEPYLLIYLLGMGFSLFQVGVLFSIREIMVYLFEVPSGVFADYYGKKRELMICFSCYIFSFLLFFWGGDFWLLIIAMIFYGLGEAFRSGTHKAMIYSYLEQKNWFVHKTFVYGRTRSFSLIGSSFSAFLSIAFILNLPSVRWIFLLSVIPYLLDFLLIMSYPDSLDERQATDWSFADFFGMGIHQLKSVFDNTMLRRTLLNSALYDSVFKTIKDYIQPILSGVILSLAAVNWLSLEPEDGVKVYLGMIYGISYIFSAVASKNIYRLNQYQTSEKLLHLTFMVTGVVAILIGSGIQFQFTWLIIFLYLGLYIIKAARRPIVVDVLGDHMKKTERATVLSVDSQLTSLFMMIMAPLFGWVADRFSISFLFYGIGFFFLLASLGFKRSGQ
ncbi:MFS transporter [Clostridiales bacterium COT073_COT-073]|nr:MFS transporter [Clostridiales bacterium COT073_COT-073]